MVRGVWQENRHIGTNFGLARNRNEPNCGTPPLFHHTTHHGRREEQGATSSSAQRQGLTFLQRLSKGKKAIKKKIVRFVCLP
jgi:hypothetical protein